MEGVDIIDGQACEKWQEVIVNGEKTSTYTLWVNSATSKPVRYEMMGYDSLLGSHYDKYILDYTDYQPETIFPDGIFTPGSMYITVGLYNNVILGYSKCLMIKMFNVQI